MPADKLILDATAGSRMMWFNKNNPLTLFGDIREESHVLCDGRVLNVAPDVKYDFRQMEFPDNSFKLVLFDPPHLIKIGKNGWLFKKYGGLSKETWQSDIKAGFDECMRVLDLHGTLIFKWNTRDIKLNELLKVLDKEPLFGHTTTKNGQTIWMTFLKV